MDELEENAVQEPQKAGWKRSAVRFATVALHRIAFLAYENPAIDSQETMVVVFSPALRDYVSHVLPALQVERVQVRTFEEWAKEQVQRLLPRLPRRIREITPAIVLRTKFHPAMMKALEQAGHKDKLANDVAFGKGVQYFAWLQGQRPEIRGAEESRIQGRNVERPILTGRPA